MPMGAAMLDAQQTPSLSSAARACLKQSDGLVAPATELLLSQIEADPDLREAIAAQAIESLAAETVAKQVRDERAATWAGRNNAPKTNAGHLRNIMERYLLDFPLAGGLRLRDATRDAVESQALLYETAAQDMSRKGRWLRLIAAKVPEGRKVGDCLTEADVRAMQEDAQ